MVVGLLSCWAIQISMIIWLGTKWLQQRSEISVKSSSVTIVVCARNESSNISACINSLKAQTFAGPYKILLVNHASSDDTLSIMITQTQEDERFSVRTYNDPYPSKKRALKWAVEQVTTDWVLVTDADCIVPTTWLEAMRMYMQADYDLVLGMGNLHPSQPPKIWQQIICWETWLTAYMYGAMAHAQKAYMGVGRNMAFRKSSFLKQNWDIQSKVLSGDDDIFVSSFPAKHRIAVQMNSTAVTSSTVKPSLKQWFHQRSRHVSTSKYYSMSTKLFLAVWTLSFIGMFCFSIGLYRTPIISFGALAIRWMVLAIVSRQLFRKQQMPQPPKSWIFGDLFMPLYYCISGILLSKKNTDW